MMYKVKKVRGYIDLERALKNIPDNEDYIDVININSTVFLLLTKEVESYVFS